MTHPVLNVEDAPAIPTRPPEGSARFGATVAPMGAAIGSTGLGAMYTVVEPGKRAFPFHNHLGKHEMFVIFEGTGTYRYGAAEDPVRAGDVCAAPKGGPETAHQLINTGGTVLKYLSISTMEDPDVVEYPDSGKFAALAIAPGADFREAHLRFIGRKETSGDYWEGEA